VRRRVSDGSAETTHRYLLFKLGSQNGQENKLKIKLVRACELACVFEGSEV
jgi:hypothetical protein